MLRSNYIWKLANPKHGPDVSVLVITDLNTGGKSVTNDMEMVLKDISSHITIPDTIIYRDSDGRFDGVFIRNGIIDFYPLRASSEDSAVVDAVSYTKQIIG